MRKLIVTTAVLLLALGIAVAQQPTAPGTSSQTPAETEQKAIRGCIGGSEGNFTLLDEAGTTYKLQGLADDQLKEHVGHTVEISGSLSGAAAGTGAPGEQTLMVSDIRMISEQCEVKTTEPSGAAAPETQPKPEEQAAAPAPETETQAQPGTTTDMTQQQAGSQPVSPDTSAQAQPDTTGQAEAEAGVTAQQPATEPAVPAQEQEAPIAQEQQPMEQEQAPAAAAAEPDQQETETAQAQLPQTASPLPLLAVLGLGSLAAGLVSRRKK